MISASRIQSSETPGRSTAFRRNPTWGFSPCYKAEGTIPVPKGPHMLPAKGTQTRRTSAPVGSTKLATKYSYAPSTNHQPLTTNHIRAAFTLIELLMVVMIIAILFSILLSAIRTVERHTLQTVTQAEIKTIETAWKQYFAHYQMWPNATNDVCLLDEKLARILAGNPDAEHEAYNRDKIIFMEFTRFADYEGEQIPVNAWGESGRFKPGDCAYYVMFDDDGDNEILVPIEAPSVGSTGASTNLFRSVAVWSFNPAQTEKGSDQPKLLGSWMQ